MNFIDISYRLAANTTCTNRGAIFGNLGPISGFTIILRAQLIGHRRLVVGVLYDFY